HIDKEKQINNMTPNEFENLYTSFIGFLNKFETRNFNPILINKDKVIVDILPFPFESYKKTEMIPLDNFTRGLSNFINLEELEPLQKQQEAKREETLGKLKRMLNQQKEKIAILDKKIILKKQEGELIYLHFNTIDCLLKTIQTNMDKKNKKEAIESINKIDFVKIFNPEENKLIISLKNTNNSMVDIPLQFRKNVSENAEHAYSESKKFQKKKHGAEHAIKKTQEILKKILVEKQMKEKSLSDKINVEKKKKKHFWFERYRWTISLEGNLILGGKDAKTNEQLIKKHLENQDRYVHADIQGAPSCIVKQKSINEKHIVISKTTLEDACIFAACYSRA
ncbi:MAG: NFACT RNA binding domain-containing protein, partial [Promethearchaeota archaeon]